jgi:hypothetical protein
MNRYNELKLKVLSLFATTQGEWLGPNEAAERLDFSPARSAWTYFKRLWSFGLLERRPEAEELWNIVSANRTVAASLVKVTFRVISATEQKS